MMTYIDIEVFDLGAQYFSYATQLSLLASFMSQGRDLRDRKQGLKEEADRLRDSIKRCGLEVEIKDHFVSIEEVMELLSTSRVEWDIANEIVIKHSRKQELQFKLAATLSSISVAQVQGLGTEELCRAVHKIGGQLNIPKVFINTACNTPNEGYLVIREHFQELLNQATDSNKEEAPEDIHQALTRILWRSKWRVFFIALFASLFALFAVWATLPENTKKDLILFIVGGKHK